MRTPTKLYILIVILICIKTVYSQSNTFEFVLSTPNDEKTFDLYENENGNIFFCGGTSTTPNLFNSSLFVYQIDKFLIYVLKQIRRISLEYTISIYVNFQRLMNQYLINSKRILILLILKDNPTSLISSQTDLIHGITRRQDENMDRQCKICKTKSRSIRLV